MRDGIWPRATEACNATGERGAFVFWRVEGRLEVLLGHPGGPMWSRRDDGAWTIPKGQVNAGEDLLAAARREFAEETGLSPAGELIPLTAIRQKGGKVVHAWAVEGDCDVATLRSNSCEVQWPPRSGKYIEVAELDRFGWFEVSVAREKMNAAQVGLVEELMERFGLE